MARVKILLDKGETKEQAELKLLKALELTTSGDYLKEDYEEPAMQDLFNLMQSRFEQEYELMMEEIFHELDKEYSDDGNF